MSGEPNLRVLQPSRKRLHEGDIFTLSPAPETYLFGRVISTDAHWTVGGGGCLLIYIYDAIEKSPTVPGDDVLTPEHLLVSPLITNRLGWSHGYFMTVAHRELQDRDRVQGHGFRADSGDYFDETGRRLNGPASSVSPFELHSYRSIDDVVSRALGIPLAPD